MIIIELTYKKSLEDVNKFLEAHRGFLKKYYAQGILIASGPKNPRDGGIILARCNKETAAKLIVDDPFYQHEIAEYKFIEFEPSKCVDGLEKIFMI